MSPVGDGSCLIHKAKDDRKPIKTKQMSGHKAQKIGSLDEKFQPS